MESITAIVLTYNERLHIKRCITNLQRFADRVIIVDSFSNDETEKICKELGVDFYQNPFITQAQQFKWALDNISIDTEWVMRMDADEYLTDELVVEVKSRLPELDSEVNGVILKRRVYFMDKWIRYGGYYPTKLLRIWRNDTAYIEQKWMDEHMVLFEGNQVEFKHDFIDYNLNNVSWWIAKHNNYSTREAIDILNKDHDLFEEKTLSSSTGSQDANRRWLKTSVYLRFPLFLRAFLYFAFRFIFKLGFLDGVRGFIWHFLQGLWYRFLVDVKLYEIKRKSLTNKVSIKTTLENNYNIKIG